MEIGAIVGVGHAGSSSGRSKPDLSAAPPREGPGALDGALDLGGDGPDTTDRR